MTLTATHPSLKQVEVEAATLANLTPSQREEVKIAIHDLTHMSHVTIPELGAGPYHLTLSVQGHRLIFRFAEAGHHDTPQSAPPQSLTLNLLVSSFRTVLHDYALLCESYHASLARGGHERLEAIDVGRRALHNEAAEDLRQRLAAKITMDSHTARSLFTLIVAMLARPVVG